MTPRWLVVAMLLSVATVAALALWDEEREASAALTGFAQAQAQLAVAATADLGAELSLVARDDDHGVQRALVPRVTARLARLESPGALLVRVRVPGEHVLRALDGRAVRADALVTALDAGATWVRLERPQAADLGLPARTAMAGLARADGGPLGTWGVAVVASAGTERDREIRARRRLALGVLVATGLVALFGGAALRTLRRGLALEAELARAELQRAREEQLARENRAAMMVTFAAGVAHEVTTPLSVIAGRAEQLAPRVAGDERGQRALAAISEQAARINDIVRGFLRLARGDAAVLAPVSLGAVVQAAVDLVAHRFAAAGVQLAVAPATTAEPGPAVRGDRRLLEQAVVNLLLNACDACERGGHVAVEVRADGDTAEVRVADDGHGISAEHAARVVEPFFSTKKAAGGTGLGLALANEIAAIHRGTLALAPHAPRGTIATVRIPIADAGAHGDA